MEAMGGGRARVAPVRGHTGPRKPKALRLEADLSSCHHLLWECPLLKTIFCAKGARSLGERGEELRPGDYRQATVAHAVQKAQTDK